MQELEVDQSYHKTVSGYSKDYDTEVKFIIRRTAHDRLGVICQTSPEGKDFHRSYKPNDVQREMIESFWVHLKAGLAAIPGAEIDGIFINVKSLANLPEVENEKRINHVISAFMDAILEVERFQLAHKRLSQNLTNK